MVHARLHVICGNCGSNDALTYKIKRNAKDVTTDEPKFEDECYIYCGNCATIHTLDEAMEEGEQDGKQV